MNWDMIHTQWDKEQAEVDNLVTLLETREDRLILKAPNTSVGIRWLRVHGRKGMVQMHKDYAYIVAYLWKGSNGYA
jgi:hypothetical protein